ncbi:MAG TPA: hypothetical protein VF050_04095, partial [Moraxellaceae bacterium]
MKPAAVILTALLLATAGVAVADRVNVQVIPAFDGVCKGAMVYNTSNRNLAADFDYIYEAQDGSGAHYQGTAGAQLPPSGSARLAQLWPHHVDCRKPYSVRILATRWRDLDTIAEQETQQRRDNIEGYLRLQEQQRQRNKQREEAEQRQRQAAAEQKQREEAARKRAAEQQQRQREMDDRAREGQAQYNKIRAWQQQQEEEARREAEQYRQRAEAEAEQKRRTAEIEEAIRQDTQRRQQIAAQRAYEAQVQAERERQAAIQAAAEAKAKRREERN